MAASSEGLTPHINTNVDVGYVVSQEWIDICHHSDAVLLQCGAQIRPVGIILLVQLPIPQQPRAACRHLKVESLKVESLKVEHRSESGK